MKIDRKKLNSLKDYVMMSLRFCEQVYEGGFDSYEQFQAFINMCENHVDMCNTWLKRIKPLIPIGPQHKMYKELLEACAYSVDCLNGWCKSLQKQYDKSIEETEAFKQIEMRCRLEHKIAMEYSEKAHEKAKADDAKKKPIGFVIPTKKKRKYTKKKNVDTGSTTDVTSDAGII